MSRVPKLPWTLGHSLAVPGATRLHCRIKTDVGTQGDLIRFLIKEVQNAAFSNIEDLVAFVKWLDDELSSLVDERAVLKHFDWPEQKADAMREAAFDYCDLKKLECQVSSFSDNMRQPCGPALKKMQALLESMFGLMTRQYRLEHGVYNLSCKREAATQRYRGLQIPWDWMLETGYVGQCTLRCLPLQISRSPNPRVGVLLAYLPSWDTRLEIRCAANASQF
ncbi:Protein INCREASED PETAL GROWTH ANISOTROPY 1 [Asimina triloba]